MKEVLQMKFSASRIALICLMLGGFSPARADITYYLDIPFPVTFQGESFNEGTVSGRIVTDGNLGYLTANDIVDWDIVLTSLVLGTQTTLSYDLQGPDSGSNSALNWIFSDNPHPLSATATSLLWDFDEDADGTFLIFEASPYQGTYFGFGGASPEGGMDGGFPGVEYYQINDPVHGLFTAGEDFPGDNTIVGPQLHVVASTPEPGAFVLLGLGMSAVLVLVSRRRRSLKA
jgi:hypothetical protein